MGNAPNNKPIDVHDGNNNEPHYFHTNCISKHRSNSCPLCRQRMEIRGRYIRARRSRRSREQQMENQINSLIASNGYYTVDTGVSSWAGDHTIYETKDYPCCSPCQKQNFCSKIFGCGADLCHPCRVFRGNFSHQTHLKRCNRSTRRRGGKRKSSKKKSKSKKK
jgi:hypothetical protein